MGTKVTLGGDRLGSGNKQKVELHGYGRSTHNLSEVFRSTMSAGTLVPFLNIVALPGDSFEIDLQVDVKTHPTIGPLFGSYKVQVDVFSVPIRLYQGKLHMNMLNIGNKISEIKLPTMELRGNDLDLNKEMAGQQVNPSALMAYLGTRGLGKGIENQAEVMRKVNAVPLLGYWDIYKNYYANKQEEIGYVIHNKTTPLVITAGLCELQLIGNSGNPATINISQDIMATNAEWVVKEPLVGSFQFTSTEEVDPERVTITWFEGYPTTTPEQYRKITEIWNTITWNNVTKTLTARDVKEEWLGKQMFSGKMIIDRRVQLIGDIPIRMESFPLLNIDKMREAILKHTDNNAAFEVEGEGTEPYWLMRESTTTDDVTNYALTGNQEGLGIKTYLSDLFNNWINTEWIEGENGINEITKISTYHGTEGININNANDFYVTLDTINLSNKIYNMLNRIAVSDGTFDSWIMATYDHKAKRRVESPVYMGGMMQELVFQEVISNSATEREPLGTLAGRGKVSGGSKKGGHVTVRVDEHSFIMGIVSLTPKIDYSQGNDWTINLKTMDDFHKPALDEIGFQDLITDQMAFWETRLELDGTVVTKSAGKQPAWTNYMTAVNKTFGNFALENEQMFMTLNRRYGQDAVQANEYTIKDLTTYIDPAKFNQIFADTRRDAQNFWVQIGSNIKARRKMSSKVMPNL